MSAASPFPTGRDGLTQFLETIELDTAGLSDQDGDAKVTLITMHNTKGLEFDRVLVTGLEDGLFPRTRRLTTGMSLRKNGDFLRGCHPGAERTVVLSRQTAPSPWPLPRPKPSRFLTEINRDLLEGFAALVPASDDGWAVGQRVFHDDYGVGMVVKKWYNVGELVLERSVRFGADGPFSSPIYTFRKVGFR